MPTKISMDKKIGESWFPVELSPSEFAKYRNDVNYRRRNNSVHEAFSDFRDFGTRGKTAFLEDSIYAIKNSDYGPCFDRFIQTLVEASLFAIITARGHEYSSIKEGVKYIIDEVLTSEQKDIMYSNCKEYASVFLKGRKFAITNGKFSENELIDLYLNECRYYGVGEPYSESFMKDFNPKQGLTIEECKVMAINKFIEICNHYKNFSNLETSIGFSDDDKRNVETIKGFFEKKSKEFNMKFNIFDSSNKKSVTRTKFINGDKQELYENLGDNGVKLLRFDAFNSQPNTLQNSTNDFTGHNNKMMVNSINNQYKRSLVKKKRKALKKKQK
jgi:hypothetical protein